MAKCRVLGVRTPVVSFAFASALCSERGLQCGQGIRNNGRLVGGKGRNQQFQAELTKRAWAIVAPDWARELPDRIIADGVWILVNVHAWEEEEARDAIQSAAADSHVAYLRRKPVPQPSANNKRQRRRRGSHRRRRVGKVIVLS